VIEAATGGDFDAVDAALESVASYSGGTADHLTAQVGTSSNRQDVFGGAIDGQSVVSDVLQSTATEGDDKSLYSALSQGFAVGASAAAGMKAVDPGNFADDAAALQALNDWMVGFGSSTVSVWLPPQRPDGTNWTIPSTVIFGDTTEQERIPTRFILPWSGGGETGISVETTITDGSPLFRFVGAENRSGGKTASGSRFIGGHFNLGGNNCELVEWKDQSGFLIDRTNLFNPGGGVMGIKGACYGFFVGRVGATMSTGDNPSAYGIEIRENTTTNDTPANSFIKDFVIDGDYAEAITHGSNISDHGHITLGGHYEGGGGTSSTAAGDAMIDLSIGDWAIQDGTDIGSTDNGAAGIRVAGNANVVIGDVNLRGVISGDGILVNDNGNSARCHISPNIQTFGTPSGDTINVQSALKCTFPYETQVKGSMTLPSEPWGSRYAYHDGWTIERSGTTTVSAGSSTVANNFASGSQAERKVHVWVASDPNANVEYDYHSGWEDSSNQETLVLEELTGNGSVDLSWRVYTRRVLA
jgi:hypothetical protein